jgi:hypothetical protein
MLFNISYYFGISVVLIIVIVIFLFIWRKITDSELYIKVLEKKITNLKKENNTFRDMIDKQYVDNVSMEMAEDIMNDVFGDTKKCVGDKCEIIDEKSDEKVNENIDKQNDDNNVKIEDIEDITSEINDLDEEIETIFSTNETEFSKSSLSKMNMDKLKDICKDLQLSTVGNKNILIERIMSR